ncbi:MAG: vWA domain-containing protein [Candidatus Dojkabacteria bacterium]
MNDTNLVILRNVANFSVARPLLKKVVGTGVLALSVVILCTALLRPAVGSEKTGMRIANLDIVLLVDISLSMSVRDYENGKNRLEKTKESLIHLVRNLGNNRYGLVTFAHKGYIEMPLTFDQETAITAITTAQIIPVLYAQGSNPAAGLEVAGERLLSDDPEGRDREKVIIMVSDGEKKGDEGGNANAVVTRLHNEGIRIYTLGAGTEAGGKVIGYTFNGKEEPLLYSGGEAHSSLEAELLEEIAGSAGGAYYHLGETSEYADLAQDISSIQTLQDDEKYIAHLREWYFYLISLFLALFLIYDQKLFFRTKIRYKPSQ